MPEPVCQNANHTFADNSRILPNATDFDGNATAYDWVLDKGTISNTNSSGGELLMILTESNGGTRLSSTRYVHYGTITARLKTGRWAGVVTAFITMSDIKDEIDWEFPGSQTTQGQTNYFWQGVIPQTTHGTTESGISDTYNNYHDYTIDWQPDSLSFLVDGKNVRTIKASDTVSNGVSQYPNTPSRIQLSLWPAGINSSAAGTVQWAGGMIDWSDPDYVAAGHFQAFVSSVSVVCASSSSQNSNVSSYVYASNSSTSTPNITLSIASTLIDGATSDGSSSISSSTLKKIGILVGCGVFALIVSALLVRMCLRMRRRRAKATTGGVIGSGQTYRPLHDPIPDTETHAMPDLYNKGPPAYGGAQPYNRQPRYGG
jgi:beta-glucanase (GH16 family)